jgi:hypothetical protein
VGVWGLGGGGERGKKKKKLTVIRDRLDVWVCYYYVWNRVQVGKKAHPLFKQRPGKPQARLLAVSDHKMLASGALCDRPGLKVIDPTETEVEVIGEFGVGSWGNYLELQLGGF